jgi:hypothetical protein
MLDCAVSTVKSKLSQVSIAPVHNAQKVFSGVDRQPERRIAAT